MNYSETVKERILQNEPKKVCCSRAMCCGIFLSAEILTESDTGEDVISFRTEQSGVSTLARHLLAARFGRDTEVTVGSRPGHKVYTLAFSSKPLRKFLASLSEPLPTDASEERARFAFKCPECRSAFLRGLFLGCGSVNDPQNSFHLEFILPPDRAETVGALLSEDGEAPRRVKRREKVGLYYKKSTAIAEFFSIIGDNGLYFEIADKQIERQIRVSENRALNCEMKNLEKTVTASLAQIAAVRELFITGEIERLPQELRETAVLRLEYDEDSLSMLAQRHVPPITKSGLNNRLRRIMEAARDAKAKREAEEASAEDP